jgi:circadian clock protein KaiB
LERKRAALEQQISGLRSEHEASAVELRRIDEQVGTQTRLLTTERTELGRLRQADVSVAASTRANPDLGGEIDENQNAAPRHRRAAAKLWQLRLYVMDSTPKSLTAFANLKKFCESHLKGRYRITVIDLVKQPQLAKGDQILAIPTVVRKLPKPVRTILATFPTPSACSSAWICALPINRDERRENKQNPPHEKALATRSKDKYVLRLFVAGATARSRQAVLRVRQLCEAELKDNCKLEVIDIYQQPKLARENQIVATPTLIRIPTAVAPVHRQPVEHHRPVRRAGLDHKR